MALIGDTKQLPATVKSEYARTHGMEFSLFERLIEKGLDHTLLAVQYRMNPTIGGFPYMYFYDGGVTHGKTAEKFGVPKFPWKDEHIPVMIIDVAGAEETDGVDENGKEKTSFMNESECFVIRDVVDRFLEGGTAASQIGIITTYKEQVKLLWEKYDMKSRNVSCDTVDRFQGDERDVIIFSAVRCNPKNIAGHVADVRRLNVALTRARRGLVVVCSMQTLGRSSQVWSSYFEWATKRSLVIEDVEFYATL